MKKQLLPFALLILAASCNKDPEMATPDPVPVNAQIATVRNSDGMMDSSYYTYYYLPNGLPDSMVHTSLSGYLETKKFVYQPGNVVVKTLAHTSGMPQPDISRDSFRIQSNLLPDTLYHFASGNLHYTTAFAYNSNGQIQSVRTFSANGTPRGTTTFSWANGNITSVVDGVITMTFQYDVSKASQPGEYIPWHSFRLYGMPYFRNKNLATSFRIMGGPNVPYQYTYDNQGRIQTLRFVESGDTTFNAYTYY